MDVKISIKSYSYKKAFTIIGLGIGFFLFSWLGWTGFVGALFICMGIGMLLDIKRAKNI